MKKFTLLSRLYPLVPGCALLFAVMGYAMPAGELPPNTIPLSQMMQQLSAQPGFTEAFLAQVQGANKKGTALLTPALVDHLRNIILGKDWQGLDHFPGWTMGEINPTVRAVSRFAGKDEKVDSLATAGGAPAAPGDASRKATTDFLDIGPYPLDDSGATIDLRGPSMLPGFSTTALVASIGDGVTRGDGPSDLAPEHPASQRLADVLNRLSANGLDGVAPATASVDPSRTAAATPEQLIEALQQTGHTVTVTDSRYFANFGHLHFEGPKGNQDVMMPFYVNTQIVVPNTRPARPLLVPVSHAEYEWHIRGPLMDADVSFYFGIDGRAEFRTMDQLDQAWVMKRDAHTYTSADAVEVTRLTGAILRTYARLHQAHPAMPFGGYYAFGVCQDVVAAIEMKMTGKTTLFPNTADVRYFTGQADERDAEIDALIRRLPKDRDGKPPDASRIFGSLPVGGSDAELASVTIPGLGADLVAVHDAWTNGTLEHVGERRRIRDLLYWIGTALALGLLVLLRLRRRK